MKLLKYSENLRKALLENSMTQKDLANLVGTTQQTISRWLQGINEPDLATLLEVCLYLDESPNAILGFDDITEETLKVYEQKTKTLKGI